MSFWNFSSLSLSPKCTFSHPLLSVVTALAPTADALTAEPPPPADDEPIACDTWQQGMAKKELLEKGDVSGAYAWI